MLEKLFGFNSKTMTLRKEIIGGITTFLTMAYILAVNPAILGDAGMDKGAIFTATILSAIVATLVMAIYAKMPFALAPGMGLNAFFAYTVVIAMGYTWQFALTAVLIEGIIFIVLTLTGLRDLVVNSMPLVVRRAIAPGIGIFIAFIGLKNAGVIVSDPATSTALGDLHSPGVLVALFGILLSGILLATKVRGALLIGILVTTIVGIPFGVTHFSGIVDTPPSIAPIFSKFEWAHILSFDMLICVFTFLFMDIFDTVGTLIGVCNRVGMVDEQGNIPNLKKAFMADAVGTAVGAVLGTSTVTVYVESAAGVNDGGRSGLTALSTSVCFTLALFLAPLFLSIPSAATAPALFLVGIMMICDIRKIDFENYMDAVPCFVTILFIPLASSISDGILLGLIAYVLMRVCLGRFKEMNIGMYILAILFILKYIFL